LMISVQNLATELNTDTSRLHSLLFQLEALKKIRLSNGSSCGSSCSGCNGSCSTNDTKTITNRTIIISMIQKCKASSDE
jgi:heterodisulfide reductase subunit C